MQYINEMEKSNIDLDYCLSLLNPITPFGLLYKSRLKPKDNVEKIALEYNRQEQFFDVMERVEEKYVSKIEQKFSEVKDLRNSFRRAAEGQILSDVELFEIKKFVFLIRELYNLFEEIEIPKFINTTLEPISEIERLLDPDGKGVMTFYVYDSYSDDLKKIRDRKISIENKLKKSMMSNKKRIETEYEVRVSPNGILRFPKEDKRLEEIKKSEMLIYSGESYKTVDFKINMTFEEEQLEVLFEDLKKQEEIEEEKIRQMISRKIGHFNKVLFRNCMCIGQIDLYIAKFTYKELIDGVKPEIVKEHVIEFEDGYYPSLRKSLRNEGLDFTPVSVSLAPGTTIITGANMGGKSVSLKLIGLIQVLTQMSLYLPCKEARVGVSQFVRTSVGDFQSTETGLSTFGAEIYRISEAIEEADGCGLLLIDELARGTNPEEGRAITRAVAEYMSTKSTITVMTTHYDEIAKVSNCHYQVSGLSVKNLKELEKISTIDEKLEFINKNMDYRLLHVDKEKSIPKNALNIAEIMGLQKDIIDRATQLYQK